ncbi:MAG: polyprenyl diphosphate synthase [bacterium]|nr:polyprenyl diphosphate synthase [bacterium]
MNLPNHIVIMPDGNRRWARKKGLPPFFGHRQGAKTLEKILKAVLELKIPYFTFWGTSLDNVTKRSSSEVNFLFKLFEQHFKKLARSKEVHQNKIKINVIGRWRELFPESVKRVMEEAILKTKDYKNYQLTFLMAYSGIDEMTSAIQRIAKIKNQFFDKLRINPEQSRVGQKSKFKIDEKLIKNNLWTKDLPAVDLVIRTGSEQDNWSHLSSGVMMWDVADAQIYFTKTLYPDFSVAEFKKAVEQYSQTERRMGK